METLKPEKPTAKYTVLKDQKCKQGFISQKSDQ